MGRRLGMRMRPPAPAMRPRLASGMPKVAWSAATTRSHESMISKPPASADPLTAAMIGLGKSRWVSPPKPPLAPMMLPPSPLLNALRSMPALKALSPLPGDDHDPAVGVLGQLVHDAGHGLAHGAVDGVARLGPVDGEDLDVAAAFPQHFVCHGAPFAGAPPPGRCRRRRGYRDAAGRLSGRRGRRAAIGGWSAASRAVARGRARAAGVGVGSGPGGHGVVHDARHERGRLELCALRVDDGEGEQAADDGRGDERRDGEEGAGGQHVGQGQAGRGLDHEPDAPDDRQDAEGVAPDRQFVQPVEGGRPWRGRCRPRGSGRRRRAPGGRACRS